MRKLFSLNGLAKAIGVDIFLPKKGSPTIPCGKVQTLESDKHYSTSRRRLHTAVDSIPEPQKEVA